MLVLLGQSFHCKSVLDCEVLFFFQAEDGIRDLTVTGVQTCALPISHDAGERSGVAHARSPPGRGWVSARAADPPPGRLRPGWGAAPWTSAGPGGRGCPAASGSPFRPGRAPR